MYTGRQLNRIIKQVGFVILLIFLFCLIIKELNYFISSLLGAFTIYMLLRKPYRRLIRKGWTKTMSTVVLLLITVVVLFVVGGAFAGTIYSKLRSFSPQLVIDNVNDFHEFILTKTGYNIFSKDIADNAISTVTKILPNIFAITGNIVTNGLMMIFVLYFMLQSSEAMEAGIERNLPLSKASILLLKKETQNMVVSNAIGIPIILIAQGIVAGMGYWLLNAGDPFVWGVITGIFGLIPIIGTAGIWVPLSINLFITGHVWQGIVLLLYGALIISSIDNLIRMVFMKKYANIHPLITIFGIILGMNLFGFWGIIFGPLVISGFMVLVKIYNNEFMVN